jgi:hypothetical protein
MFNPTEKPNEKESAKPASRYSYPQLAFKLPALAPGQNSIGTGGQYSIGADKFVLCCTSDDDRLVIAKWKLLTSDLVAPPRLRKG